MFILKNIKNLFFVILVSIIFTGCIKPHSKMVIIPGGYYPIGTDSVDTDEMAVSLGITDSWFDNERPQQKLKLSPFYMDKYEVTNKEYKQFIDITGYAPPKTTRARWKNRDYPPMYDNEPVANVTWYDAVNYCNWSNKRLPYEEEWEAAARGKEGFIYPWGNEFDITKANLGGKKQGPVNVGSFDSSPVGLYDMTGNVWEWTNSWFDAYKGNDIPNEHYGKMNRVIRGSSWSIVGHYAPEDNLIVLKHNSRTSFRLYLDPSGRTNDIGFRCVKSIPPFYKRIFGSN